MIISVYGHDGIDSQVANTFEFTEILTTRALTINTPKCLVLQMLANTWSSSSEYPYASMNANTGHSLEVLTSTAANLLSVYSRYEKPLVQSHKNQSGESTAATRLQSSQLQLKIAGGAYSRIPRPYKRHRNHRLRQKPYKLERV